MPRQNETVHTADAVSGDEIADLLDRLVAKSLIAYDHAAQRYRCLETVRQYAREQHVAALDSGGRDPRGKHAAFFYDLIMNLDEPSSSAGLAIVEADYENLRQALDWWSMQSEGDEALRMVAALYSYWYARGLLREGCERTWGVLQGRENHSTEAYGRALFNYADLTSHLGNTEDSQRAFEELLTIARKTENVLLQSMALSGLAGLHQDHIVDFELSRTYRMQALELAGSLPESDLHRARHYYNLGDLTMKHHPGLQDDRRRDVLLEAQSYLEKALELSKTRPDSRLTFFLYAGLGGAALNLGDLASAKEYAMQGLRYCIDSGNMLGMAALLALLAYCAESAEAYEACVVFFSASGHILDQTGFVPGVHEQAVARQALDACLKKLGPEQFELADQRGRSMSAQELLELAKNEL